MVAGPPKVGMLICCFVLVSLLVLPSAALSQDVRSSSPTAENLITAITEGDLLAVLSLAEIGSISPAEANFVVAALETAFAVLLSGESDLSTVMNALSWALDTQDLGVIDGLLQSQIDSSRAANAFDQALMDNEYEKQNSNLP
jgi:hypothetical protein